jgi:hypothetical protein
LKTVEVDNVGSRLGGYWVARSWAIKIHREWSCIAAIIDTGADDGNGNAGRQPGGFKFNPMGLIGRRYGPFWISKARAVRVKARVMPKASSTTNDILDIFIAIPLDLII